MLPDGQGAHPGAHVHVGTVATHAPSDAIIISDAHLLFTGDFKRAGVDLILSGDDREIVLHDYFKGEKRAALASSDGAHLTGDIINALTGHTQFAQADGSASTAQVIGHVTKLTGTATAIRNGVSIILNQGDNVNKGDVVAAGSDSTLGITFIDGTVFGLASNAKMVLNEMVYDPNGSDNKSLISLVQGTISFVAGATAKHGDMKVDTPVATMGIRGTAVLVEIDFTVPATGGAPPAKFQVLIEPDGTTGSYILFDKTTLTPIATVNQAGTQTIVNGQGGVNFLSSAQLSADAQKIITDVFALKFSDLNNPTTKTAGNQNDTIVPETLFVKTANGDTVPVTVVQAVVADKPAGTTGTVTTTTHDHIPGKPDAVATGGTFIERAGTTGSAITDSVTGTVAYADVNAGDVPTVKTAFDSFTYQNALHADVSATLTAEQLAAIHAVEVPLVVVQDPAGINHGTATWTYNIADGAFDFLAAGETLTLTYIAQVDNNFAPNVETSFRSFTITITGTNDAPTITTSGGAITERIGTGSTATDTATGTVSFTDVDLTDRPVVSTALSVSDPFRYFDDQGHDVTATLTPQQLAAILAVEVPLSVVQAAGNTHNGSATWTYSIADHAFDFIAKGEKLTLNYVAQVDDGHGGVVSTPITVSINGADITVTGTDDVPTIDTTSNAFVELSNPVQPNPTGSAVLDTVSGTISFTDVDLTDRPVASAAFSSFAYQNASHVDVTSTLTAAEVAAIAAVEVPLTVTQAAGNTNNGSATWTYGVADGAFDFLAAGETLTLTYTATVDDGRGGVITEPFTIVVTGTNDTPVITSAPQTGTIAELADTHDSAAADTAHGAIQFTDVDLTDTHDVAIVGVSASGVTAGLAGQATQLGWLSLGTLTDSIDGVTGSKSWTFSAADHYFDYLADGEAVTLTYTVQVDDHHGGITAQDVTVTVTGANDAPQLAADVSGDSGTALHTIDEAANVTGDVSDFDGAAGSLAFRDVDLSDTHTFDYATPVFGWLDSHGNALSLTLAQQATLTAASSLTLTPHDSTATGLGSVDFSYGAVDSTFDFLAAGEKLTITYDITVFDEHNAASMQPVTITVIGSNDAPVAVADSDVGHIVEAGNDSGDNAVPGVSTTTGDVLGNDTDVDLTDTHEVVGVVAGTASGVLAGGVGTTIIGIYGSLVLAANGTWTYTLDNHNPLTDALAQGVHVNDIFSYTESDHNGGTSTTTLTIDVAGTNDAPITNAAPSAVTDINSGAPVVERGVNPGNTAFAGVDTATGNVLSNDFDVDTGDTKAVQGVAGGTVAGPLTGHVASSVAGLYGSVTIAADGTWTYTLDNSSSATQALTQGEHVSDVFTYTMHDTLGSTASATLTIDITGTNDAPTLDAVTTGPLLDTAANDSFGTIAGTLVGHDLDSGETATLSYAALDGSSPVNTAVVGHYGSLTVDAHGVYSYVPDAAAINALHQGDFTDTFTIQTRDANGAIGTATFTVDVTGADDAPVTTDDVASIAGDARNISGNLLANDTDAESDKLSISAVVHDGATPDHFVVDGTYGELLVVKATGEYTYTLGVTAEEAAALAALRQGVSAQDDFTYTAFDGSLGTDGHLTVTVHGTNDAPSIVGEADAPTQAVMVVPAASSIVLAQGVNTNSLGLNTETFDGQTASNNGIGHGSFYSAALDATFSGSGNAGVVHGSVGGVTAAPFLGPLPGAVDTTNYLSIGGGGVETITFGTEKNAFGLYWGSVDSYNTISFYDGTKLVASYSGANVTPLFSDGNQGSFSSNGYVEFLGLGQFNKVVLASSSNAFEIDNISAGTIAQPHSELTAPITGTLSVHDADIGDSLTASVIGQGSVEFTGANGSTHLPNGVNIAALIDAHDVTFDTVQSDGGTDVLHWSYHPTNPDLDFLKAGDVLKIEFNAQVNDGHGNIGSQPLTVTLVGANSATNTSAFSFVDGTSGNDTFNGVGGNVAIFGGGGQDTFVFKPGFGKATIADFDVHNDTIEISHTLFASIADILSSAHPINSNLDTIITDAALDTITLKGVTAGQLQASNFHLV